ncbi:aldose 1-epimerase family protein [Geodermatophilus sabuli]|uniref:Aldose 1-epimerase family protein n=1 Tax=Geodermatophilus sabuli TaxID=1564158 RepID=A0A7K3VVY0_9ACTN|nr:aldose 1-epimerase family protein [Geodermatophilus sabuli]NEK56801.1 aldose 1-epimerase family protein [Geodermatophilus sabuli]
MTRPPTGEQFVLRSGDAEVTVVEVGGGLRTYRCGDREVLDGYDAGEAATDGRGQVLAPWPNRLRDGAYSWDGGQHRTPVTEPERGTALHGLVRSVAWSATGRAADRVVLSCVLHPQPGYPFTLRLQVAYELSAAGLRVTTTATNDGDRPLPYGEGHHPYLAAGPGLRVDDCTLVAPGAVRLETDDRGIPTGAVPVADTAYDLRTGRPVGDLVLDSCSTDLDRDADGLAWVRLTAPDGRGAAVWMDAGYRYLQLFTGDVLPAPRRRRGLAVEPMTCPPNALQTGEGVVRLAPGESTTAAWGIRPLR